MGLDFDNSEAHWSYGGFHRFRTKLAAQMGLEISKMEGFGGITPWPDDVFCQHFMNHSDCDDDIAYEHCEEIATKLREMVKDWPEDDYDKQQALLLAEGLEYCAEFHENMVFC